ncbi:MAG TPA: carboxypeptidase-like regulatory domain-containing protein [Pyrinomonadaceae bacterium]|nr:carboxypeptidase-like regulatory domain-containing protein [Pyrinomonadaceae bacterium]
MKRIVFLYAIFGLMLFLLPLNTKAAELITNGGFETGNHTGWTTQITGSNYWTWAVTPANGGISEVGVTTSSPIQGSFSSHGGFCCNTTSNPEYIQQQITIPAAQTAQLKWSDKIQSNLQTYCTPPACGSNVWRVQILNTSNVVLQTLYTFTASGGAMYNTGWVNHSVSLNAYAGQTIRIRFSATYSSSISGNLNGPGRNEVDAVSVQSPSTPTAANVSVGGRVSTDEGAGISRVVVTLTDGAGNIRSATTNSFGYYNFDQVAAGGTYIIAVNNKKYLFADSPRVVNVQNDLADVDFRASP